LGYAWVHLRACARVSGPTHSLYRIVLQPAGTLTHTCAHAPARVSGLRMLQAGPKSGPWKAPMTIPYWLPVYSDHTPTRRCDHWLHTIGSSTHCASTWFRWFWRFWLLLALFVIFPPKYIPFVHERPANDPKKGSFWALFGHFWTTFGQFWPKPPKPEPSWSLRPTSCYGFWARARYLGP